MRSLHYNDTAREHMLAISRYIKKESGSRDTARSFIDKVRAKCRKIAALSGTIGRDRSDLQAGLRSFVFGNYLILFRYLDNAVEIIAVVESHRDIVAQFRDDRLD